MCHNTTHLKQKPENIEDRELHKLIDGCIKGIAQMQRDFYYQYFPVLMRIGLRYSGNQQDAEQWVHDGFLKVFQSLNQYSYAGSFDGWIKKIMVRTCLDNIRKERALKNEVNYNTIYSETKDIENSHYIDNEVIAKIDMQQLIQLFNVLPHKQRAVFNLHVFEGYGHKEIATLLSITENHSYWLLHQARKAFKENIDVNLKSKEASYE